MTTLTYAYVRTCNTTKISTRAVYVPVRNARTPRTAGVGSDRFVIIFLKKLAFVLVWFVSWVGLCAFPPRVYALGSAVGDASTVFIVPTLASLSFVFDHVRHYV